jgi:hypothetical protein
VTEKRPLARPSGKRSLLRKEKHDFCAKIGYSGCTEMRHVAV